MSTQKSGAPPRRDIFEAEFISEEKWGVFRFCNGERQPIPIKVTSWLRATIIAREMNKTS